MDTPFLDKILALSITKDYQRVEHGVEQHVSGHTEMTPGGPRPAPGPGGYDPRYGGAPHRMVPHVHAGNIAQHMLAHGGVPDRKMTPEELLRHHAGLQHDAPGHYGRSNHFHGEHTSGGGGEHQPGRGPVDARAEAARIASSMFVAQHVGAAEHANLHRRPGR